MPYTPLSLTHECALPTLASDESVLHSQSLVYLYLGSSLLDDAHGRGTLTLTTHRIIFVSDEDVETRSFTYDYEDCEMHAIVRNTSQWPHKHLLVKLDVEDASEQTDADTNADGKTNDGVWIRRVARRRRRAEDAESEEEDDTAATSHIAAASSSSTRTAIGDDEYESVIVTELRFVPPNADVTLPLIFDAWNRGDEINTLQDDEDDDEADHADEDAKVSDATPASARVRRQRVLRRVDGMLIVPPVRANGSTDSDRLNGAYASVGSRSGISSATTATSAFTSSPSSATSAATVAVTCAQCAILRACSVCVVDRRECAYSNAQLKRKGKRICRVCVARKEGAALPLLHGDAPVDAHSSASVEPAVEEPQPSFPHPLDDFMANTALPTTSNAAGVTYTAIPPPSSLAAFAAATRAAEANTHSAALFQSIMLTAQENLRQLEEQ